MKINKSRKTSIILLSTYIFLLIYSVLEQFSFFGTDIGVLESFKVSEFTRAMFLDIGILATLAAFWIIKNGIGKYRMLIAIGVLFVGSFVLLPYLAYYFWNQKE